MGNAQDFEEIAWGSWHIEKNRGENVQEH